MAAYWYPVKPSGGYQSDPRSQDISKEGEPEARKVWQFDDPFEYAPKKPNGNHWELLLEPLLKSTRAQCDNWKDEVSNLLIFAGLFSAVVTAFIIESYKGLQRDPNDDIVSLLSQILIRNEGLPKNLNITSFESTTLLPTFSPTASSIRINVFWFISLVLSLTTVLVGIVSLQWLREYQNYSDLTPRQQYAIFNMRREGLEKWHIRKIFTAMPLLLQSALVLFFAGIIDFLQAFGHTTVVTPVTIIVGLSLLFLIPTTLLPTLQGFCLFSAFHSLVRTAKVRLPSVHVNRLSQMLSKLFLLLYLAYYDSYIRICGLDYTERDNGSTSCS